MKRFILLLLISCIFVILPMLRHLQATSFSQPDWVNHRVSNTLFPTNQYRSIAIDQHGNKWVGTENSGLLMFDGTNWENFTVANTDGGLTTNRINHLTFDRHGNLWISTNGGGLVRRSPTNDWLVFRLDLSDEENIFPSDEVNFVVEDIRGFIWVGTNDGMVRIDFFGGVYEMFLFNTTRYPQLLSNRITSIQFEMLENNLDVLWIGTWNGLVRFDFILNNWQNFTTNNSALTGNGITNLLIDNLGNKWMSVYNFTTASGAGLFRLGTDNNWRMFTTGTTNSIPSNNVRAIEFEAPNIIWVTTDNGIGRLIGESWTAFNMLNTQNQIQTNNLHAIAIENGIKWFGTSNNLLRHVGTTWSNHPFLNAGIPHDNIQTIAFQGENAEIKWIGTANGLTRFNGSSWRVFNVTNSPLPSNDIRSLAVDRNNNLWIGTAQFNNIAGGLARYRFDLSTEEEEWEIFTVSSSNNLLRMNTISKIAICRNNFVWIGTPGGGLYAINPAEEWAAFTQAQTNLGTDHISDIFIDRENNKWIATDHGISVLNANNTFKQLFNTWNSGLLSNNIRRINQDNDNMIWAVTDRGLAKLLGNNWIVYNQLNTNNILHETGITNIAFDRDNIKWITTNRGLVRTNEIDWSIYTTINSELHSNNLTFIKIENIDDRSIKWMGSQDAGVIVYRGGHQLFPNNAYINVFQHPLTSNLLRISGIVNNFSVSNVMFRINTTPIQHTELAPNTWLAEHTITQNENMRIRFTFTHALGDSTVHLDLNVGRLLTAGMPISLNNYTEIDLKRDIDREHWLITEALSEGDKPFYRINLMREDLVENLILRTECGNAIQQRDIISGQWQDINVQRLGDKVFSLVNESGDFRVVMANDMPLATISNLSNFPNPFNPYTSIRYQVSGIGGVNVEINVYNVRGQKVQTLLNEVKEPGHHSVVWNGKDNHGNDVSSGIYFVRAQSNNESLTRKILLLK